MSKLETEPGTKSGVESDQLTTSKPEEKAEILVLYNNSYGEFCLSKEFYQWVKEQQIYEDSNYPCYSQRADEQLIQLVKEFGLKKASGRHSRLAIERITFDRRIPKEYLKKGLEIREYDGLEAVCIEEGRVILAMLKDDQFTSLEQVKEIANLLETSIVYPNLNWLNQG